MVQGIHEDNVTGWLAEHVPELKAPVTFRLLAGGHSNLTFACTDASGARYVLRRPPLGHVLESAHDMGREFRIISALQGTDVPVPVTFGLCKEKDVNEADFYVMSYVDGLVLHDSVIGLEQPQEHRHALGIDVIGILCALHEINPDDVGLGDLGRKEAYLERQLKRWTKQWEAAKTHEVPAMDEACRLLTERMPAQVGSAIVHGDFRLGNMLVDGPRVQAILDWELCTLGDPLADVGYLLNNWVSPGEVETREGDQSPTAVGGYPTRDELCEIYASRTGRDLSGIDYYRAFSHWRLASIGQGVYKRYLVGAMGDNHGVDLDKQKEGVQKRAEAALELLT